jgi:thiol:disulfide interchange protein DsbC
MQSAHFILAAALLGAGIGAEAAGPLIARKFTEVTNQRVSAYRLLPELGLYELIVNDNVVYVDPQSRYLIKGPIFELASKQNLTKLREDALRQVAFGKLPFEHAIITKRGTGKESIAIFADPSCPSCRKLETDIQNLPNVTVYTFLISSISFQSRAAANSIWCAQDRAEAWAAWAKEESPRSLGPTTCEAPTDFLSSYAQRIGIHGVPTVIYSDGSRSVGARSWVEIDGKLKSLRTETQRH